MKNEVVGKKNLKCRYFLKILYVFENFEFFEKIFSLLKNIFFKDFEFLKKKKIFDPVVSGNYAPRRSICEKKGNQIFQKTKNLKKNSNFSKNSIFSKNSKFSKNRIKFQKFFFFNKSIFF